MGAIKKFEELEVWKKARRFSRKIYAVTRLKEFGNDYALRDQMRRASISIVSNIAEGFSRRGNKEFIRFLDIARASSAEVQAQLYIALDQEYFSEATFNDLYASADEISRMTKGLMNYLEQSRKSLTPNV